MLIVGFMRQKWKKKCCLVHSIRKFFKTQLISPGVGESYVDFWMDHVGGTYHDIEMKGIEFLPDLYTRAGLSIRPRTINNKVDLLNQMSHTVGASHDDILRVYPHVPPDGLRAAIEYAARTVKNDVVWDLKTPA